MRTYKVTFEFEMQAESVEDATIRSGDHLYELLRGGYMPDVHVLPAADEVPQRG